MQHTLVLGLQWGDEGKGKLVDVLSEKHDIVVRFNGGSNAGHSIYRNGQKHAVHQLPAGVFYRKILVIANGCVVDPIKLRKEIEYFTNMGYAPHLIISDRAHLVLPRHIQKDVEQEKSRGTNQIGTTLSGNGPVHADKAARLGIRVRDAMSMSTASLIKELHALGEESIEMNSSNPAFSNISEEILDYVTSFEGLKTYVTDTVDYLHKAASTHQILFAGAHGTMLDIEHGDYPMVTSSNVCLGGAIQGTGMNMRDDVKILGVIRPYATRVGGGYMVGEMTAEEQDLVREVGNEYGTTTGRPRRVSWLDLDQLDRHIKINGVDELVVMKVDVLNGFREVKYVLDGDLQTSMGWESVFTNSDHTMNHNLRSYLETLNLVTGVRVKGISYGTDPKEIYWR